MTFMHCHSMVMSVALSERQVLQCVWHLFSVGSKHQAILWKILATRTKLAEEWGAKYRPTLK